jgi:hypothetical protein
LAKKPLKDVAMMNATRWRLFERLKKTGLLVERGTGATTKMQRIQNQLSKEHYFDALCVGENTPTTFTSLPKYMQVWSVKGRGSRQMCRTDKYGFPIAHRQAKKLHFGFQTGDLVVAEIPKGKYQGKWQGRVLVRKSGRFDVSNKKGRVVQGVSHRYLRVLQRNDGWQYEIKRISA